MRGFELGGDAWYGPRVALRESGGDRAGPGQTFSRKQTSPRMTSAQTSKRGSPRTAASNSRASPTCCGEGRLSEPAPRPASHARGSVSHGLRKTRAAGGKGRRPQKNTSHRLLLLRGRFSHPNPPPQHERRRCDEGSEHSRKAVAAKGHAAGPRAGRGGRLAAAPGPQCRPPPGAGRETEAGPSAAALSPPASAATAVRMAVVA